MIIVYFEKLAICFNYKKVGVSINKKYIKIKDKAQLNQVLKMFYEDEKGLNINLYGYEPDKMFSDFCSFHNYIEAAGGIVINQNSEYLLIKRFGIWDLPKGKVETGETVKGAAIREVCEETGLKNVEIISQLPDTFHIYHQKGKWYVKKTYWFLMNTKEENKLVPEVKEDISEAVWMNKPEAHLAISNSYRSLFDILGYLFC